MTGHDNFDRSLAEWLQTDALSAAPADGLDRILDVTRSRRPRPAWLAVIGSRWVGRTAAAGSSTGTRTLARLGLRWSTAFILILVIAALVSGAFLVGARLLQPPPVPADSLSHLAYGLDGSIYVADLDGSNPVRIADGGPTACGSFGGEGPIWSPDGRHLAYRSAWMDASCQGTPGEGQVYIADPDGHLVTSFPGVGWRLSWSPDSTRVATSVDLGHTFGIYGLDGVRQALLTMPPGYELHGDYDPVWSPDGMSLLMPIAESGGSENWELPIDGGTPWRVPDGDPLSHQGWAYSPDGSHVAYTVEIPYTLTGTQETLNVAAADGSQTRVLFTGGGGSLSDPVWSPTGDRIIFSQCTLGSVGYQVLPDAGLICATNGFLMVDIATGVVAPLVIPSEPYDFGVIRFAPEGDRILLGGVAADSDATSLWSMRADGSDLQLLVNGTDWGDWQPAPTAR